MSMKKDCIWCGRKDAHLSAIIASRVSITMACSECGSGLGNADKDDLSKILSTLRSKNFLLSQALDAARKFISSHVCDPDITSEMWDNYQAYLEALDNLNKP